MSRRRLLLVAFHYPPIQGSSGVHRSLAFSKYLPEFGWDVSVLTVVPRAHERIFADNQRLIPPAVQVIRAQAWDAARHFAIRGRYPTALALPDRWSSWVPFATRAGVQAAKRDGFDAIFSTFPIASAHVIGGNLHRRTRLPWLADFRDPMATTTYPHDPSQRRRWKEIQDTVMREASRIVVTTPGAAAFYNRMYPNAPKKQTVVIENGFDPDAFPESNGPAAPKAGAPLTLLHSGILYPRERDPKPFFRALKRMHERGSASSTMLRVTLRASGFESQYQDLIRQLGIQDLVTLAPPLPYTEALEEMRNASALLLFQASNCNEQIPAKAYEYLYAERPILGFTDPAGDTGRLLERFGVPGIVALEDEEGIMAMLEAALPSIRQSTYKTPSREAVMSVSRRAGAQQLAELLDQVVSDQQSFLRDTH